MQNETERQELRRAIKEAAAAQDAATAVGVARKLLATSSKPADVMFCASAFTGLAKPLTSQLQARRLKTHIVRSVTIEPILPFLTTEAVLSNYVLDLNVGGYGSYVDELLNPQSALARFKPDLLFILLDLEDIAGSLPDLCAGGVGDAVEAEVEESVTRVAQLLRNFRSGSSARILFQGCVVPDQSSLGDVGEANLPHSLTNAVYQLNQRLAALCRTISDCVFFDVDHLAARHGRANWRDARMFLASRLPVSSASFGAYSRGLVRSFSPSSALPARSYVRTSITLCGVEFWEKKDRRESQQEALSPATATSSIRGISSNYRLAVSCSPSSQRTTTQMFARHFKSAPPTSD
ncbi:hypothetical protein RBB80_31740 [Tunturiibacter gelidiferens]